MQNSSKSTIAIVTNFNEFHPGYSLTGIVVDQAHMLARHGHKVVIFVNEQFNTKYNDDIGLTKIQKKYPEQISVLKKTAFAHLIDYEKDDLSEDHKAISLKAGQIFAEEFIEYDIDVAFTHDLVFTGWNLVYYYALIEANRILKEKQQNCYWYHWIHSVPVPAFRKPWWSLSPLGTNHFLVFPNKTEIMRVAESWMISTNRIRIIPHIKDMRTWYDFCEDSMDLIDICPKLMQAHISQVYPCSTDRLSPKQLDIVIRIFAHFKKTAQIPVFLVIANQWATGKQPKENIKTYTKLAESIGLINGEDFCFTSELSDKWSTGISKRMLRELQLLTNIFIFPSKEESFGLVAPEATFSGALPVVNRSLNMMMEVMSPHAAAFDFGSFHHEHHCSDPDSYYRAVAIAILNRMNTNEAIKTKIFCRLTYNMDSLYYDSYVTIVG